MNRTTVKMAMADSEDGPALASAAADGKRRAR